jgi:two-component system, cell cycle response regulator DivK
MRKVSIGGMASPVIRTYLHGSGLRIAARMALAIDHGPWLMLMDIELPDMDGVAALGRLRTEPVTAGIQVVASTAFAMKESRDRFLTAGFDSYLAEPIDLQAFPQQIRGFLQTCAQPAM